jgi:hypothetical protein
VKRLNVLFVLVLTIVACGEPEPVGSVWINGFEKCPSHEEYGDQVANGANLWEEKSTTSSRLALVQHGTKVDLLADEGGWVKVRYIASTGYMQKILVSDYDPSGGVQPDEEACGSNTAIEARATSTPKAIATPRPVATSSTYSVVYNVYGIGTNRASLTIENETGGTEQKDVTLPWSETFTAEYGQFVYLSAQNDKDSGTIKCEILVNNQTLQSSTSDGAYAIASCSGSVGRD